MDDTSASQNLFKTGKMLICDVKHLAKRGKSQANPGVASFHWKIVDVHGCDGRVRLPGAGEDHRATKHLQGWLYGIR